MIVKELLLFHLIVIQVLLSSISFFFCPVEVFKDCLRPGEEEGCQSHTISSSYNGGVKFACTLTVLSAGLDLAMTPGPPTDWITELLD